MFVIDECLIVFEPHEIFLFLLLVILLLNVLIVGIDQVQEILIGNLRLVNLLVFDCFYYFFYLISINFIILELGGGVAAKDGVYLGCGGDFLLNLGVSPFLLK